MHASDRSGPGQIGWPLASRVRCATQDSTTLVVFEVRCPLHARTSPGGRWSPPGGGAVRSSALWRMGIVAVAVATPDLTVFLVDNVLGPLTPRRFASCGLRSRLCGKDSAYPGSAFAAVGPAAAMGHGVKGRLLRHGEPRLEMVPMRRFCLVDVPFAWTTVRITPLCRHAYRQLGRSGGVSQRRGRPRWPISLRLRVRAPVATFLAPPTAGSFRPLKLARFSG